mmetsp:Transcript_5119/g.7592  ORF Transcript_5119/g.7592 Transcript_5119/m.7592 type:complete len:108 (+) Transcript_5119:31-354(+)
MRHVIRRQGEQAQRNRQSCNGKLSPNKESPAILTAAVLQGAKQIRVGILDLRLHVGSFEPSQQHPPTWSTEFVQGRCASTQRAHYDVAEDHWTLASKLFQWQRRPAV